MSLGKRFVIIHAAIVAIPMMATFVASFIYLYVYSVIYRVKFNLDAILKQSLMDYATDGGIIYFLAFAFLFYLVALFITGTALTYKLRSDVVKPVKRLKNALDQVSGGNLNSELIEDGVGELKEVTASFEKMRLKLKESVYLKQKYDDNRKMLISSISHDLRTPLTSIKGYIQGVIDGVADSPEKTEKYLLTSIKKTEQMETMIEDLLLYSKLDLGQLPFRFEKTDIGIFFDDCVEELKYDFEKSTCLVEYINSLHSERITLLDRESFRRVITNILDNAMKYMDKEKGIVNITLRELQNNTNTSFNVIIEISDNGMGIPKDEVNKIFDRFYRADSSRGLKSGSGLGLAIAKQIVEGHGGKIWAKSKPGEGTSIIISLPVIKNIR
jgi:signal transduction histidine kinase